MEAGGCNSDLDSFTLVIPDIKVISKYRLTDSTIPSTTDNARQTHQPGDKSDASRTTARISTVLPELLPRQRQNDSGPRKALPYALGRERREIQICLSRQRPPATPADRACDCL